MNTNAELEWFAEFVLGVVDEKGKSQIFKAANERYDQIAKAVEKNPMAPSSIAERVLEWFLDAYCIEVAR